MNIDILFDGPPGPVSGRFVEVESPAGVSIKFGSWVRRDDAGDDWWALRIGTAEFAAVRLPLERRVAQLEAALRECIEYCEGIQTPPPWMEQCRAALAGAP